VLAQDGNVVAAVRNPASLSELLSKYPKQLVPVKCDVTVQADVDAAFAAAKDKFGHLDAVWNNAGYSVVAEIEAAPIEDAKALFDVRIY
jgi:NADP-dependent 3-hydroxy acid dehydrogenase YdfG